MKTEMGLVSSSFIDNMGNDPNVEKKDINEEDNVKYDKLIGEIKDHTTKVAQKLTQGQPAFRTNQMLQLLMLS